MATHQDERECKRMAEADDVWRLSPPDPRLLSQEVHVWRAYLGQPAPRIHELSRLLSNDERERAERFHFEHDRRRFIVGRGALRILLGRYLRIEPAQLRFRYGLRGKPYLSKEFEGSGLAFNAAHSNELAVYAITSGREVGIDLEYIRPLPDAAQIAARFFSARENMALVSLPASQRLEAFFSCWTRKEAYIKAVGDGLARPLDQFQVSLTPGEPVQLLWVEGRAEETTRWSMEALAPAPGYVGAIAVEGSDWHLERWQCLF